MMLGLGNLFVNLSCRARSWGVPRKRHSRPFVLLRHLSSSVREIRRKNAPRSPTHTAQTLGSNTKWRPFKVVVRGRWWRLKQDARRDATRTANNERWAGALGLAHNGSESRHEEDWEEEEKSEIIVIRKSRIHRRSLLQNPARCADSTVGHTFSSFQEDFPRWGL